MTFVWGFLTYGARRGGVGWGRTSLATLEAQMPTSTVRVNIAQLSATRITEVLDEVWTTQFGQHTTFDLAAEVSFVMNFLTGASGVVILFPPSSAAVIIGPNAVPFGEIWDTADWDTAGWSTSSMKFQLNATDPTPVIFPQPTVSQIVITASVAIPGVSFYFF